jgi:2-haloalkanoic acid dehalogenase type II
MPKSIQAVLFDLGNTLLHFDGSWPQVFQEADQALLAHLKEAGLQLDDQAFLKEFRRRLEAYYQQREAEFIEYTTTHILRTLLAELGYDEISEQLLSQGMQKLYAVSQQHWHAEEDTLPTLKALQRHGYRLGIISNAGDDADVQALVDNAGLRPYLDFVISSAASGIRKPNPRIFQQALSHWELPPEQAVMVGDTLGADILGARNAGIYSIWLTRHADTPANRDHAETIVPDAQIAKLAELPPLLERLAEND